MYERFRKNVWVETDRHRERERETVRIRNRSEISRRDLQNDFHFLFPTLQHLSFRLHRRARPVVGYKTRTIIFDYMSLTLATLVRVACAIPAAREA